MQVCRCFNNKRTANITKMHLMSLLIIFLVAISCKPVICQELSVFEKTILQLADRYYQKGQNDELTNLQSASLLNKYGAQNLSDFKDKFGSRYVVSIFSVVKAFRIWTLQTPSPITANAMIAEDELTSFLFPTFNYLLKDFFRRYMHSLLGIANPNLGDMIRAYLSGNGFCTIFKHPDDPTSDMKKNKVEYSDDDRKFAKFSFFIVENKC